MNAYALIFLLIFYFGLHSNFFLNLMTCGMVICKLQVSLTCFSHFFFVMQLLKGAIQLKHDAAGLLKEGGKLYLAELADKKKKGVVVLLDINCI